MKDTKAEVAKVLSYSNTMRHFSHKKVPILKRHHYTVSKERISGDAPKDFISVYEYGRCRKSNPSSWIRYIAKIGHKWYPSESITEHLLTRLGQEWGFTMADSKLYMVNGQLRFCSEFFRKQQQELVHGADILARHLQEGNVAIIAEIDKNGWSQELLSLQFVRQAIAEVFPEEAHKINASLHHMLLFDAIVGNNDRHFFNWGILRHLSNKHRPFFSPIYDTARGLFWNYPEKKIVSLQKDSKLLSAEIVKYHNNTRPKIGWENEQAINHFELVDRMLSNNYCTLEMAENLFSSENLTKAEWLLNNEFNELISSPRKNLILQYLAYRFAEFNKLLHSYHNDKQIQ